MMTGNDRAAAVYAAIAAQGNFDGLNADEKSRVKAQLQAIFGADLSYITGTAQVLPNTLQNPAGQPVATSGSAVAQSGSTTAPSTLIGTGRLT